MNEKLLTIIGLALVWMFVSLQSCNSPVIEEDKLDKPKMLWFDSEANFKRFSSKDCISYYLDKVKDVGFNEIVVDVRPVQGDVLYKSDFLTPLSSFGDGYVLNRDWDYLDFFIQEARKRGLKITVSASILPAGLVNTQSGPGYRDSSWNDLLTVGYTSDGLKSMKDMDYIGLFLSPHLQSVRSMVKSYVSEIVTRYDFDGLALDYCRFADARFDFSDSARVAFEQYIGQKVDRFPEDVYTYDVSNEHVPGKWYKEWWEFRAMTIRDLIAEIRGEIKAIKPEVKLTYWAASWIHAIYKNGQNWASKKLFDPSKDYPVWASSNYKNAGFADQLEFFIVGAYLTDVYGMDNPESIEFALDRANRIIGDDCAVYGSIYGEANKSNMEDAVYLTLSNSAGLMIFDIVQVIQHDLWNAIEKGIQRAEEESQIK